MNSQRACCKTLNIELLSDDMGLRHLIRACSPALFALLEFLYKILRNWLLDKQILYLKRRPSLPKGSKWKVTIHFVVFLGKDDRKHGSEVHHKQKYLSRDTLKSTKRHLGPAKTPVCLGSASLIIVFVLKGSKIRPC